MAHPDTSQLVAHSAATLSPALSSPHALAAAALAGSHTNTTEPFPFLIHDKAAAHSHSHSHSHSLALQSSCEAWQCSAPGKALLTGGYLVLEPRYCGLVFALSARFHAAVVPCLEPSLLRALHTPSEPALFAAHCGQAALHSQPQLQPPPPAPAQSAAVPPSVMTAVFVLHAPQRSARLVEYWVCLGVDGGAGGGSGGVTAIRRYPADSEDNPFVLCSLYYTLHFLSAVLPPELLRSKLACPVLLHVRGDYQFYAAQPLAADDPRWLDGKTGLGSSATLTSSLVGALCLYFQLVAAGDAVPAPLLLHSSCLPHHSLPASHSHSDASNGGAESAAARLASSLDSSFTVVEHDLSTFPASSSASLPACWTLELPHTARVSLCHRLSQLAHCAAQGKVGSGFDVSAAHFGNQLYRRFSPQCIARVLPQRSVSEPLAIDRSALLLCILPDVPHHSHRPLADSSSGSSPASFDSSAPLRADAPLSAPSSPTFNPSPGSTSPRSSSSSYSELSALSRTPSPVSTPPVCSLCFALRATGRRQWDEEVAPLQLPGFLQLLLADVRGGAKTPGMVQQVQRWRANNAVESERLYSDMEAQMAGVQRCLASLAASEQAANQSVANVLARLAVTRADDWSGVQSGEVDTAAASLVGALLQLRQHFATIRSLYRSMGEQSGVAIEPPNQTALCDATQRVEGVLAAGVPGAGGNDAIFILALRRAQPDTLAEALQQAWQQLDGGDEAVFSSVSLLPVEQFAQADGQPHAIEFSEHTMLPFAFLGLPTRPAV